MTEPGALNIVPPPAVPAAENITVKIEVGLNVKKRLNSEPFRPSISSNTRFEAITNLRDYRTATHIIATDVWAYKQEEKALDIACEIQVHCAVRLENVTHPVPGKGVVILAKGHRDTAFSDLEFNSSSLIEDHLNQVVNDLRIGAKY